MNPIYILAVALLISLSSGLELSIAGNSTGAGYSEMTIICPDCNISGNATTWIAELPTHDIFGGNI